jgi:DNA repair protein RadC
MLRHGAGALLDAELLAVLIGTGARGHDALAAAHGLLTRFRDLRRIAGAGTAELAAVPGVGFAKALRLKAALALAARLAERPIARGDTLNGPIPVFERLGRRLLALEREVFLALALDVKNRVLSELPLAQGGTCSVEIHPRDVFSAVLREGATSVIFVHNHPSGDPTPSDEDRALTFRLKQAGELVGVRVLDHIIVAQHGFFSFEKEEAEQKEQERNSGQRRDVR